MFQQQKQLAQSHKTKKHEELKQQNKVAALVVLLRLSKTVDELQNGCTAVRVIKEIPE